MILLGDVVLRKNSENVMSTAPRLTPYRLKLELCTTSNIDIPVLSIPCRSKYVNTDPGWNIPWYNGAGLTRSDSMSVIK